MNNNRRFIRRFKHRRFWGGANSVCSHFLGSSCGSRRVCVPSTSQDVKAGTLRSPCHFCKCIARSSCDAFTVFIYPGRKRHTFIVRWPQGHLVVILRHHKGTLGAASYFIGAYLRSANFESEEVISGWSKTLLGKMRGRGKGGKIVEILTLLKRL